MRFAVGKRLQADDMDGITEDDRLRLLGPSIKGRHGEDRAGYQHHLGMTDFQRRAVGHAQPKRHERPLTQLLLDFVGSHSTPF